jgi:hypothetical protein
MDWTHVHACMHASGSWLLERLCMGPSNEKTTNWQIGSSSAPALACLRQSTPRFYSHLFKQCFQQLEKKRIAVLPSWRSNICTHELVPGLTSLLQTWKKMLQGHHNFTSFFFPLMLMQFDCHLKRRHPAFGLLWQIFKHIAAPAR